MKWDQLFMFRTADGIMDLSPAIGEAALTPLDAHNQPACYPDFRYRKHEIRYRFDPETYVQGTQFS